MRKLDLPCLCNHHQAVDLFDILAISLRGILIGQVHLWLEHVVAKGRLLLSTHNEEFDCVIGLDVNAVELKLVIFLLL